MKRIGIAGLIIVEITKCYCFAACGISHPDSGAIGATREVTALYVTPGLDQNISLTTGGNTYYYTHDGLGSVRTVTDSSGDVINKYDYTPFGKIYANNTVEAVDQRYTYTGREQNPTSPIMYYRYRTYSPGTGRFISRDPIGYEGGINVYSYSNNNVINTFDPFGLWTAVERDKTKNWASVCSDKDGDTWESLAAKIKLDPDEYKKWTQEQVSKKPKRGKTYHVPNTAYIDVSTYTWAVLGWQMMSYKSTMESAWEGEGLKIVYTHGASKTTIKSHLGQSNIYKYLFIGHGEVGRLIKLDDPNASEEDVKKQRKGVIRAGRYTPFKIAEMQVIACESNHRAEKWKKNVSSAGNLRTVKGVLRWCSGEYIDENGE